MPYRCYTTFVTVHVDPETIEKDLAQLQVRPSETASEAGPSMISDATVSSMQEQQQDGALRRSKRCMSLSPS